MNRGMRILISLLLFITVAKRAPAGGDSIAVIVNMKNPVNSISKGDLRKIYQDRMLRWEDGMPITVYDLSVNDPVRETFSQLIFALPSEKMAEMWAHLKITNQAKNPPTTMKSEYVIMKMVATEEGAIGYVSLNSVKGAEIQGLKVIATLQ